MFYAALSILGYVLGFIIEEAVHVILRMLNLVVFPILCNVIPYALYYTAKALTEGLKFTADNAGFFWRLLSVPYWILCWTVNWPLITFVCALILATRCVKKDWGDFLIQLVVKAVRCVVHYFVAAVSFIMAHGTKQSTEWVNKRKSFQPPNKALANSTSPIPSEGSKRDC